jgi:hypothetical protein
MEIWALPGLLCPQGTPIWWVSFSLTEKLREYQMMPRKYLLNNIELGREGGCCGDVERT